MFATSVPRTVLMTADTVGGVWTYAIELARALQSHGVTVYLATMGGPAPPCDLPNVEIFESGFRLEWMENPWDDVRRAGEWLLALERRLHPELIHLNNYAHGALDWDAPVVMVGHSCVLSWWEAVHGCAAPASWNHYRDQVRRGLHKASVVVAPSAAMLNGLTSCYGPLPKSCVIANGLDASRFSDARPSGERMAAILTAGRLWDEAKNIGALARVAESVEWPIYLAGDNQHPDGGVPDTGQLHLLGRLAPDVLASWYARSAIYALPARYEPFGLSVLEAALSGCALVLGDIESLRENWAGAALFVNPADHAALAQALNRLIADPELRHDLSQKSRLRAAHFTAERMLSGYLDAYRMAAETLACA